MVKWFTHHPKYISWNKAGAYNCLSSESNLKNKVIILHKTWQNVCISKFCQNMCSYDSRLWYTESYSTFIWTKFKKKKKKKRKRQKTIYILYFCNQFEWKSVEGLPAAIHLTTCINQKHFSTLNQLKTEGTEKEEVRVPSLAKE